MSRLFETLILIIYLAVVFTLVRPGSQGPSLVKALGDGLAGIITAATGGGAWSAAGSGSQAGSVYA